MSGSAGMGWEMLRDGLCLRAVEGVVYLDRPAPVRRLATATLRGLVGYGLMETAPDVFYRYFKPSAGGGNIPPAYVFQPLHSEQGTDTGFPFRIVTWDRDGLLLEAILRALDACSGWPFGGSGATLAGVSWGEPGRLHFAGVGMDQFRLILHTPLALVHHRRPVGEADLSLGLLVGAAVRRLNQLSSVYGNKVQLWRDHFVSAAIGALETGRSLRMVNPVRYSRTQDTSIHLGGVVGWLDFEEIHPAVGDLLCSISAVNVGRHTAEGCGHLLFRRCLHD